MSEYVTEIGKRPDVTRSVTLSRDAYYELMRLLLPEERFTKPELPTVNLVLMAALGPVTFTLAPRNP